MLIEMKLFMIKMIVRFLIFFGIIYSCNSISINEEYIYYENGAIKTHCYGLEDEFNKKVKYCKEYSQDGILMTEGKYINNLAVGWHEFYNSNKRRIKSIEYKVLRDTNKFEKSFVNQVIYFSINGDTLYKKSNFLKIYSNSDTIVLGEEYRAKIQLIAPYFKESYIDAYFDIPGDTNSLRNILNKSNEIEYNFMPLDTGYYSINAEIHECKDSILGKDEIITDIRTMYTSLKFYVLP